MARQTLLALWGEKSLHIPLAQSSPYLTANAGISRTMMVLRAVSVPSIGC